MLEHRYRVLELKNGEHTRRKVLIDFEEERYELLSRFIEEEGAQFSEEIKDLLDAVLEDREPSAVFRGNLLSAYLTGTQTVICTETPEEGVCAVPTAELKELLAEWQAQ